MDTFLVTMRRTLSVRHAVEETLEVEVEAADPGSAEAAVRVMIDAGDTEGQWEEGQDKIVGSDVLDYECDGPVRSDGGVAANHDPQ